MDLAEYRNSAVWQKYDAMYPSPAPTDQSPTIESSSGPATAERRASLSIDASERPNTPLSMGSPYPFSPHSLRRSSSPSRSHESGPSSLDQQTLTPTVTYEGPVKPPSTRKEKEKQIKHRLTDADRKKICLYQEQHPNARQEDIGLHFGVERSTISKILKCKERWLMVQDEATDVNYMKHRPSKFPWLEMEMMDALQYWTDNKIVITDQLIRQKAMELVKSRKLGHSLDKFKASAGWVENFKHRHNVKRNEWQRPWAKERRKLAAAEAARENLPVPVLNLPIQPGPRPVRPPSPKYDGEPWLSHHKPSYGTYPAGAPEASIPLVVPKPRSPPAPTFLILDPALGLKQDESVIIAPDHAPLASLGHVVTKPSHDIQHSPDYSEYYDFPYTTPAPTIIASSERPPRLPPPTLEQAERAIDVVLVFLSQEGPQSKIMTREELITLHHAKCALFNYGIGLPYERK